MPYSNWKAYLTQCGHLVGAQSSTIQCNTLLGAKELPGKPYTILSILPASLGSDRPLFTLHT